MSGPSIKWWVHALGLLALYGVVAQAASIPLRAVAWLGVVGYAVAWWACIDEFLKFKEAEGDQIPSGLSGAWPVGVVLIVGGALTAFLRPATALGLALLGVVILVAGYFVSRAHS